MTKKPSHASPYDIVRVDPEGWRAHRELRLQALLDAPEMFGGTHAESSAYDEATWRSRLSTARFWHAVDRSSGERVGMVGRFVPGAADLAGVVGEATAGDLPLVLPWLISMYVGPRARGTGAGEALVRTVLRDALDDGHEAVGLEVTSTNAPAIALYARCGFVATGDVREHPREPDLHEVVMLWRAAPARA